MSAWLSVSITPASSLRSLHHCNLSAKRLSENGFTTQESNLPEREPASFRLREGFGETEDSVGICGYILGDFCAVFAVSYVEVVDEGDDRILCKEPCSQPCTSHKPARTGKIIGSSAIRWFSSRATRPRAPTFPSSAECNHVFTEVDMTVTFLGSESGRIT